jgi:multiple sugar transport system substrate-binding protein
MMAKAATGAMTAEESVKWAAQRCEDILLFWLFIGHQLSGKRR